MDSESMACDGAQQVVALGDDDASDGDDGTEAMPVASDGGFAEGAAEDDADADNAQWKKERVAIIFGYIGERFQGLQKNPGAFAVEDELEGALHRAGGIATSNLGDFHKIGWNRCARTDKGVHAMGQVVSLKLRVPRCSDAPETVDYAGMRDRINAQLPADVRVFDVCKVTGTFNSHPQCSGRRYEYIMPTLVLQPPRSQIDVVKPLPVPQALKKNRPPVFTSHDPDAAASAADPMVNGSARAAGAAECGVARSRGALDAAACAAAAALVLDDAITSAFILGRWGSAATFGAVRSSASAPDAYQTGAAMTAAREFAEAARSNVAEASIPGPKFRVSEAVFSRFEAAIARYAGTHAFHNFTPRLTFGDASTVRYIKEARVSRPFIAGSGPKSLECVRVTFVGQSFLLNQIRHMVGLAIDIARGAAPAFLMQVAFGHAIIRLPLAPAEGLFLDHCFFESYDKQCLALTHQQQPGDRTVYPSMTVRTPAGQAAADAFRADVLMPHMMHSILETRPFHAYISGLLDRPLTYRVHIPRNLQAMLEHGHAVKQNPSKAAALSAAAAASGAGAATGKRKRGSGGGNSDEEGGEGSGAAADAGMSALEWFMQFGQAEEGAAQGIAGARGAAAGRGGSRGGRGGRGGGGGGGSGGGSDARPDDKGAIATLFKEVDTAMLSGGYVSREAKERNEFRHKQKRNFKKGTWGNAGSAGPGALSVAAGGTGAWRGGARGVRGGGRGSAAAAK